MEVEQRLTRKLQQALSPLHLEVVNESNKHNVPAHSETHFRVLIVADAFTGQRLLQRHRRVQHILRDELAGPVHALSLQTCTGQEWSLRQGDDRQTPECLGGDGSFPGARDDTCV